MYTSNLKGACKYALWVNGHITVALYSVNQSEGTTERPAQTENSSMISNPIRLWTDHCPTVSTTGLQYVVYLYIYDNTVIFSPFPSPMLRSKRRFMCFWNFWKETCNLIHFTERATAINIDWEPPQFYFPFLAIYFVLVTQHHSACGCRVHQNVFRVWAESRQVNRKPFRKMCCLMSSSKHSIPEWH